MKEKYELRYLPLFYDDIEAVVTYIAETLNNPDVAVRLIDDVERAILTRFESPEMFAQYESERPRKDIYYKIRVRHYLVFYVIIDDGDRKIMEVRRFLYGRRNLDTLLK